MLDGGKPTSWLVHGYGFSIVEFEPKREHPCNAAGQLSFCNGSAGPRDELSLLVEFFCSKVLPCRRLIRQPIDKPK
jgi:hypothetical protein